jgi:hypothetical protein
MEYWVTIAIPSADQALAEAIYVALVQQRPEAGAVMDIELAKGRTSFVLGIEAGHPLAASTRGVEIFQEASAPSLASTPDAVQIVDLHAEIAPEAQPRPSALQTA